MRERKWWESGCSEPCRQGKILGLERKGKALEGMTGEHGLSCYKGISLVAL